MDCWSILNKFMAIPLFISMKMLGFNAYIGIVLDAVRNGSNTKGYFVWTFLDRLELLGGFNSSLGMYYVDLDDKDLERYGKLSGRWYTNFLKGKSVEPQDISLPEDKLSGFLPRSSH